MRARQAAILAVAGVCAASGAAHAFCGFYVGGAGADLYNNATQVVLMRQGTTTVLAMENNYQGPPADFALVVPVPVVIKEAQVKTLPRDLFDKIDTLTAPRLVEYWEQDPCPLPPPPQLVYETQLAQEGPPMPSNAPSTDSRPTEPYHVTIEAQFAVGEYDIVVLSATDSTGLERWLRDHHYKIPKGAAPLLRPYVETGTKFFVARVDPKKVTFVDGMATLSPLRVDYDSTDFALPIRLGLANSSGTQDLIVNIIAPVRYEVANRPNVTIPTNLVVKEGVRDRFGEFYAALFDHVVKQVPTAVVTEYAWDSSSCDPCPGPVLDQSDILTLGGDVLAGTYQGAMQYGGVLTRLHMRYGTDLADDLVFRAVAPLVGGRGYPDNQGAIANDVAASDYNNFQGRYTILHWWTGPMKCEQPQRGVWGGPPAGSGQPQLAAATNTAFAPRGKLQLAAFAGPIPPASRLASNGAELPGVSLLPPELKKQPSDQNVFPHRPLHKPQGCTCSTTGGAGAASALLSAAAVALVLRRRRR